MSNTREDPQLVPKEPDASLGELFGRLTRDIGQLFRQEVNLAKAETKEEAGRAAKAGGMLVVGGLIAYLALVFASPRLLDAPCASVEEVRLVNTLCALPAAAAPARLGDAA